MAKITLGGTETNTIGDLPAVGAAAPDFTLVSKDMQEKTLASYHGQKVILNIYPSIDTGICAMSTKRFNEEASKLENTRIVCISKDLPFALKRYCDAENIENLDNLTNFRDGGNFGKQYGVEIFDGAFKGLNARAIVVVNEQGAVKYTELVPEVGQEPDYEKALAAL
ncbi:thiol peroxidase (atypical 2-Cys peroxiredoxin) [Ekhidna lutea]|uniref:Thiol peroxidase (Atypical 2-Cys peroxiredoxin) n=1 Tax=Ekhidna lutea TaxID=447679 RepID=A0A239EZC9_EKHLU|nr:thiol peroxidase [Ekhidna lutea]SNS49989.1 thiol peroxidase (atypical 2-Cys peroxiredoxin) [Ekhidna lutea]